jgi:threonine dehydratase
MRRADPHQRRGEAMITLEDIREARSRIAPHVKRTPLERSATLSRELGAEVHLKLELFQLTGSFKPRGAFNQILALSEEQRRHGVVGVSGGNFAQGMALAARELETRAAVCMPASTPRNYLDATRGYGAEVHLLPDISAAFARAEELRGEGWNVLHPFDTPEQMAGAGTVGLEIVEDVPELTDLFISIGGGGLYTGVAVAVRSLRPGVRVWGIETEGSETMGEALRAGRVVRIEPRSLARTLGSPYIAEDALSVMQSHHPGRYLCVSDREAFEAGVFLLERAKLNTELAASCTLAAARRRAGSFGPDDRVVLLLCGGNSSLENWVEYRRLFA